MKGGVAYLQGALISLSNLPRPQVKTAVSLLNPNFAFCACLNFTSYLFCIWMIRLRSVRPVNGFMVGFSSP